MTTEWKFTVKDLQDAWPSLEVYLLEELHPNCLLIFFEKERIMTAEECEEMYKLRRREVVKELLQRIKAKLPESFSSFIHALNETKQQVIVQGLRQTIEGIHDLQPLTHDQETKDVAYYALTLELSKDGNILHETESKIIAYLDRGHIVFDYDMISQCLKWEHGSVIIHLRPLKKLTMERLARFCQYGGMKNYLLDLLEKKDIFASLPEGEMSMQVQVHCYDEDLESKGADGKYKDQSQKIDKHSLCQHNSFTITENPQVIKQNLLLQYNDLVEEIEPVLFQKTFVAKGICDISFFDELKMGKRKERTAHFLDTVLDKGETALAALVHTLRKKRMYYLFNRLCIAQISSQYIHKGVPCSDPKLLCQFLNKSQQAASLSQSTLEVNCRSVGLELHDETPANGNCFFEAVSSQLQRLNCGVQKSPQQLRQEVVAFMRANRVLQICEGTINLSGFIYNETYDVYCSRMATDGEWADHVVVVAMARMLQMDFFIVTSSPSSGPDDIIVWVVGQTGFQGMPILLGHIWESHYLSLQPIRHVDDSLIKIVQEDSATQAQEPVLWSCKLVLEVRKNEDGHGDDSLIKIVQEDSTAQAQEPVLWSRQLVLEVRKNEDGTPRSTSTERAEKSIEAKKKHNQLCTTLYGYITKDMFKSIKQMARTYLDRKTVEKAKNMYKLWSSLEVKGVIRVGMYDTLIAIMTDAGVGGSIVDEIRKAAKDIKDITQNRIPVDDEHVESSHVDTQTSSQGSIHLSPVKKKKHKHVSESSSDSRSASESESARSSYSESGSEDEVASHKSKTKGKEKRKRVQKKKLKKKQKRRKYGSKDSETGD